MDSGPQISAWLDVLVVPFFHLDAILLVAVLLTGALARAHLAAWELTTAGLNARGPGGDGAGADAPSAERTLAARMVWFSSIPPAFLLLVHLFPVPARGILPAVGAYVVAAFALLVVVDALPARLGGRFPRLFGLGLARLLAVLSLPVRPVARYLIARRAGEPPAEPTAADEELLLHKLIDEAADDDASGDSPIDASERELLGRLVRMRETTVAAVMQPRDAMLWLHQGENLEVAAQRMVDARQARLVIVGRNRDDVLGILHLKDLFVARQQSPDQGGLVRLARQAVFVREEMPLDALIASWRRLHGSVSVVRGAGGGVVGLVRLGDVLGWLFADLSSRSRGGTDDGEVSA